MKKTFLLAALLSITTINLWAATPSFDFIQYGFTIANVNGMSKNLDGTEKRLNKIIYDNFYVLAENSLIDRANRISKLNKLFFQGAGLGYKYDWSNTAALFYEAEYIFIDPDGSDNHEKGYQLTAGIRNNIKEKLELKTAIEYLGADGYKIATLDLGATYSLTKFLAVYSDLRYSNFNSQSNHTRFSIGARLYF